MLVGLSIRCLVLRSSWCLRGQFTVLRDAVHFRSREVAWGLDPVSRCGSGLPAGGSGDHSHMKSSESTNCTVVHGHDVIAENDFRQYTGYSFILCPDMHVLPWIPYQIRMCFRTRYKIVAPTTL